MPTQYLTPIAAVITFATDPISLATILPGFDAAAGDVQPPIQQLLLVPDAGNGATCFVGTAEDFSTEALELPAGADVVAPISIGPFSSDQRAAYLSHFWVDGTSGQKLRVLFIPAVR